MKFNLTQQNKHNTQSQVEPPSYLMLFYENSRCLQIRPIFYPSENRLICTILPRIQMSVNQANFLSLWKSAYFTLFYQTLPQVILLKFPWLLNFTLIVSTCSCILLHLVLWDEIQPHTTEQAQHTITSWTTKLFDAVLQDSENRLICPILPRFWKMAYLHHFTEDFHKPRFCPKLCFTIVVPPKIMPVH